MTHARRPKLLASLDGLAYPCDRTSAVRYAAGRGADDDVLGHLSALPDRQYPDLAAIEAALDAIARGLP